MAASFYSTRKKERERRARKLEGNRTKRGQRKKDEKYDPLIILREDIKRIRASISDSSLTHRQRWRQTEDVGLPSCLRVCTKLKGKISHLSSLDATEAEKLSAVYDELFTTINVMAQDHKEYISNIYDEEEVVKKYYNKTVLDILELWSSCASATVDLMVPLVEKYWKKREYKQLAKKISNTCSACVKFSAMAVNFTKHPLPENCGSDVKEKAIQEMNNTADTLGRLIQAAIKTSLKVSEDSLLDMTMWLLFSVHHVAQNVLQPKDKPTTESKKNKQSKKTEQEKKDPEPVKESTNVTASLNNLLTQLHALQMELRNQYVIKKRPEHNSDSESESETDDSSDSIEAEELSAVYDEQCTTINGMAQDDKEYISNTYDKEEVVKKRLIRQCNQITDSEGEETDDKYVIVKTEQKTDSEGEETEDKRLIQQCNQITDSEGEETDDKYVIEKNEQNTEGGETDDICKNDQQAINKLANVYKGVVDKICKTGKVTVVIDDPNGSDATIYYTPDVYTEVANCSLGSCPMKDRDTLLKGIDLVINKDAEWRWAWALVSDVYVVRNGPLRTSAKIEIDFTLSSPISDVDKIAAKQDGKWKIIYVNKRYDKSRAHFSFKTQSLEAFTAFTTFTGYVHHLQENCELDDIGVTITREDNPDFKVIFPPGLNKELNSIIFTTINFISYNAREVANLKQKCPDSVRGIMAVSDAVNIKFDRNWDIDIDESKNIIVQVSMDDKEHKGSQLVVIRFKEDKVQVLDKSQCRLKKDGNLFLVETNDVSGIAVARIRKIFLNMRDTIKKEFQLIFGMAQVCNICTFIDDSQRNKEEGSFFVRIEVINTKMMREDLEKKKKAGLIEVKQSRSKDITLRQKQTLILKIDGQVKLRLADPSDVFKITYLIGAENHVNIPLEVHRDKKKIPYAAFAFYEAYCAHPFHSINIPVRGLLELPTDEITAKTFNKDNESNNLREQMKRKEEDEINAKTFNKDNESNNLWEQMKRKEEAARKMLSYDSILNLSRVLSEKDGRTLGVQLGVSESWTANAKDECDGDILRTNFRVLCEWRGKAARAAMVDFLISSLKTVGRIDLANVVSEVYKNGRALSKEDFD